MGRLLTFFSLTKALDESDWLTVYVPLSPKEIPRNQLENIIRGWLNPELVWAKGYMSLEEAISSQQRWRHCERFPNTESLRVIIELQVPCWLVYIEDDEVKVDLDDAARIRVANIYVTAKCAAGFSEEESLPGDLPFNGTVYEVIDFTCE